MSATNSKAIYSTGRTRSICKFIIENCFGDVAKTKEELINVRDKSGELIIDVGLLKNILERTDDRCSRSTFDKFIEAITALAESKDFGSDTLDRFYLHCDHITGLADWEYTRTTEKEIVYNEQTFNFHLEKELDKEQLTLLDYFFDAYSKLDSVNEIFYLIYLNRIDNAETANQIISKAMAILEEQTEPMVTFKQAVHLMKIAFATKEDYKNIFEKYKQTKKADIIKSIQQKVEAHNEQNKDNSDNMFHEIYGRNILFATQQIKEYDIKVIQILILFNLMSKKGRRELRDFLESTL